MQLKKTFRNAFMTPINFIAAPALWPIISALFSLYHPSGFGSSSNGAGMSSKPVFCAQAANIWKGFNKS